MKIYIGIEESYIDGHHTNEDPVAFATKELAEQWQKEAMRKCMEANDIDLEDPDTLWERSLLGIVTKNKYNEEWVIWPIHEVEVAGAV